MKKQNVSLLAFLLAASSIIFSCGNKANSNTGSLEFDSIQANETVHLFGDTTKPACNLILNLAYASKSIDARLQDSINSYFLTTCLGPKYTGLSPQEAIEKYAAQYSADYRKDLEPLYAKNEKEKEDSNSMTAWYSYYKKIESNVQLYSGNLLVYRFYYEEFTGGAHGIHATNFLNLNLRTLTPIRLDDLFVAEYKEALTDLLWNQLMADNNATSRQELEEIGYASTGELEPTENFCIGKDGITFLYNVYEITPYVMGVTQISLPYEMMQHLLSDESGILSEIRK